MSTNLGYDFLMKRATVTGLVVICLAIIPAAFAQINGVPASVTSIGFGGHPGPHGVAPSVTSIGPKGLVPNNQFPTPGTCCINPLFPSNPNPGRDHHHHNHGYGYGYGNGYGYGYGYAVPYAVPYYVEDPDTSAADVPEEPYNGGPTIFDRRGAGQPAPYQVSQYSAPKVASSQPAQASSEPAADQPQTILVFKDGHEVEVSNYAIVGSTLYDLTPGHTRRVPLADLNLAATSQQNDSQGIDFQLPGTAAAN